MPTVYKIRLTCKETSKRPTDAFIARHETDAAYNEKFTRKTQVSLTKLYFFLTDFRIKCENAQFGCETIVRLDSLAEHR